MRRTGDLARVAGALASAWLVWLAPTPAAASQADLRADALRVAAALARGGARPSVPQAIFVERGSPRRLSLAPPRRGCATLAVVAPRTAEFTVATAGKSPAVRSSAGIAVLRRCGAKLAELRAVIVGMRSPRAALEVLLASGGGEPPELLAALPERAPGRAPRGPVSPGPPLDPGPLSERIARAASRARADGAESVVLVGALASASGAGAIGLLLAEGCHRLDVLAEAPRGEGFDLDVEAREAGGGRKLARDASEAPDAQVELCLGAPARIDLVFRGARVMVPVARVTVSVARWPLPAALPRGLGGRARAGFALALHRRGLLGLPSEGATDVSVGAPGKTSVPLAVERGACYVAALAAVRGEATGLRLEARLGARALRDDSGDRPEGAALAFCAEAEDRVVLDVDVRGTPGGAAVWWALALFPVGALGR